MYQPDPASIGGVMPSLRAGTLPLMYFTGLPLAVVLIVAVSLPSFGLAARAAGLRTWHVSVGLAAMALVVLLVHANPWQLRVWLAD